MGGDGDLKQHRLLFFWAPGPLPPPTEEQMDPPPGGRFMEMLLTVWPWKAEPWDQQQGGLSPPSGCRFQRHTPSALLSCPP